MTHTVDTPRRRDLVVAAAALVLTAALLTWAKWWPYAHKLLAVAGSHTLGAPILTGGADRPPAASLAAGLSYAGAYFAAIWPALVAGLAIAAAVETALPQRWLSALARNGARSGLFGGLLALPSMMCTCCAAPVAVGLRRRRVSMPAALVYWVANPALNPVVIAFCLFVLPWPWAVLRAAAGLVLVGGIIAYVRWRASGATVSVDASTEARLGMPVGTGPVEPAPPPTDIRGLPRRFVAAFARLVVRLLPEYLLLVVVLGALRGWLFPFGPGLTVSVLVVVGLAVAGLLLPIPTAGEVPVVGALLAVGAGGALAAALLITLPAVSLPSLVMVRHAFPARVLVGTAAGVVVVGLATAAAAWALGL